MSATEASDTIDVDEVIEMIGRYLKVPFPPPTRIIVGFPLCPPAHVVHHQRRRLILMGRVAYENLIRALRRPENEVGHLTSMMGMPFEFYGDKQDHHHLFAAILLELDDAIAGAVRGVASQ